MTTPDRRPAPSELEALWALTDDLLSITGADGRMHRVNGSWVDTLGWSPDELTSRPLLTFVHADDRDRMRACLERLTAPDAQVERIEARWVHVDGGHRWLSWTARSDPDGTRAYAVARDVSEQRQAEAALRASERRFRQAVEAAPIGMAVVGLDGRWLQVNEALARIVGHPREELLRRTFHDLTHPDDVATDLVDAERLLAGEIPHYTTEKRYRRADGQLAWVLLSVSLLRDEGDEPVAFISQVQDITPRKEWEREQERLRTELERSNADLELFAASASHDLTSPLSAARGSIDLVLDDPGLSAESRTLLQMAQRRVEGSIALTKGLLRFSLTGTRDLDLGPVDTDIVVHTLAERIVGDRPECQVEVVVDRLPRVLGDGPAITTLFANLLENAVKFSPADRPCRVRVSGVHLEDDVVVIVVEDEGPGVPVADRERIFEAFTRSAAAEGVPGSGLGLATCRRIVERHGGSITVGESETGGARFEVRLRPVYASTTRIHPERDGTPAAEAPEDSETA